MTPNIQAIDQISAAQHGFRPVSNYLFAKEQPALPIQISEIGALVASLPLAFAKMPDGMFVLVAVTGFKDGRNLFVDEQGRWGGRYLPNHLRAYPFSLQAAGAKSDNEQQFQLCFDRASGLYCEKPDANQGEIRFFDDAGNQQETLKQAIQFLSDIVIKQNLTQTAVNSLAAANLLKPWAPIMNTAGITAEPTTTVPQGLFCIDEQALRTIEDATLVQLHRDHALAIAYAQLLSMSRVTVLVELLKRHQALAKAAEKIAPLDTKNLAQMFGDPQGEILKFDWMK
ncbi:SapC family protein [Undibacterium flavidum]|uniref:SapC family protein n=1 Tax=Undibacterium flavidum TaxID=2762297 RepID=A0ABR6YA13_9BURK|nr:SapC family protein [Undibacterium flavidum]MBC3873052.1 SapC family protein [Undibacterium flavidum]